ncbi:acetate/propionate family kinase [Tateyamaria pelophila]|uniref:acetate/propionate family kinase n=1 Tax=Tateyamaria pelophila TaxID=328415 RepID=UPI001CBDD340|nr:acetate/propionate family kinase [Tateyamaria pelophila]
MAQKDAILVVNAGSSSLKFQIFEINGSSLSRLQRGQIDGIGVCPVLSVKDGDGEALSDQTWAPHEMPDLPSAISKMSDWIRHIHGIRLRAVGHRVVHGGPDHAAPLRITADALEMLASYQDLAPLHQPNNLAPIRLAMQVAPHLPQIACFDTAFHRSHPAHADCYALPDRFYQEGIRRYGFHGLSYEYIAQTLPEVAPELCSGRVIVAHLGSGASMCALRAGQSIESTMGFTALDGLPMSTRSGQLDPGVVLYMISHMGMSAAQVTELIYHNAGLKGLSGVSGDMRELLASNAPRAQFAIDHFVHRCGLNIGMLAAALDGLDGFVFTAGIGENSPEVRARVAKRLQWLGATLDPVANAQGALKISTPDSRIGIYVVPTDEELVIAKETLAILIADGFVQKAQI